jgi:hypothetical protein
MVSNRVRQTDNKEMQKVIKFCVVIILVTVLCLAFSACQSPTPTTIPTSTSTSSNTTTSINPELIEVVSVRGPLDPINPGGPNVEVTLKNLSSQPVTALTANLQLDRAFNFKFDVSAANPLLPGKFVSARLTLIGGGFNERASYLMVVNGVLQDGQIFSLNKQVKITP